MAHADEGSEGTPPTVPARSVLVLVGALWGMRSLQSFSEPNFTDPESVSDWVAVVSLSLSLMLLPAGLAALVRLSQHGGRAVHILVMTTAAGAVIAAIANVMEDGGGVDAAGSVYFVSIMVMMLAMVALGGVLLTNRPRWPGVVVLITVIGILNLESGGGVLVLLGWVSAAIAVRQRTTP